MITLVLKWMQTFLVPTTRDEHTVELYSKLIEEEHKEVNEEYSAEKTSAELKECVDLLWVTYAKVLSLGYTVDEVSDAFDAVYRSNMSKCSNTEVELRTFILENNLHGYTTKQVGEDKYVLLNSNGKIQKGPNYHAAKIKLSE